MLALLEMLGIWAWFIAGVVLMIAEVFAPGAFLLWLGLAAFLVGILSFVVDWSWQAQFVAFAVFAVAAVPLYRRIGRQSDDTSDQTFLNRRTEALVGRAFALETPIVNGVGTVRIDDTVWRVQGPDSPGGSRVKIVKADGATLTVAPE
jgi:membrane protein implicated in regulation of membrane protease activity